MRSTFLGLSAAKVVASRYLLRRQCRHLRECFLAWEGYISKTLQLQVCFLRKKRLWAKRTVSNVWSGWIWVLDENSRTKYAANKVCRKRRISLLSDIFQSWNAWRGPSFRPRSGSLPFPDKVTELIQVLRQTHRLSADL